MSTVTPGGRMLLVMAHPRLVRKAIEAGFDVYTVPGPERPDRALSAGAVAEAVARHRPDHLLYFGPDELLLPVLDLAWAHGLTHNPPEVLRRLHAAGDPTSGASRQPRAGTLLSVETLTSAGVHHVIGISARLSGGWLHPAPLPAPDQLAVEKQAIALLDQVGYQRGPAHTEVVLAIDGPRVVRARGRLGGSRIPLLVQIARGLDLEAAVLAETAGERVHPPPPANQYGQLGFFELAAGRLRQVTSLESISVLPYIHAVHFPYRPDDRIPPARECSGHGYVVVAGASPEEAARRTRHALSLLRAEIEPE